MDYSRKKTYEYNWQPEMGLVITSRKLFIFILISVKGDWAWKQK